MYMSTFEDYWSILDRRPCHPEHELILYPLTEEESIKRGLGKAHKGFRWFYFADYLAGVGGFGYVELDEKNKEVGRHG